MAHTISTASLIQHLKDNYQPDELLVADLWSCSDVELVLTDEGIDLDPTEVWEDIADSFESGFDYTTDILNSDLFEKVVNYGKD